MALDIDGSAVLRSVLEQPEAFPDLASEINKVARALVTKQLKARGASLDRVRRIQAAIGRAGFRLVIDGLKDAETKTLLAKVDKNHPDLKSGTGAWRRGRIVELADGAEPAQKPDKARGPAPTEGSLARPGAKRAIRSKALAVTWDGKNIDDEPEVAPQNPAAKRSTPRR